MQNKNQKNKANHDQQATGTAYNQEHAGDLPDYGMNTIDPNAESLSNSVNTTDDQNNK